MTTLRGIDISVYQGDLDFTNLKSSFDFVIARAGFGNGGIDKEFIRNRDGLRGTNQLHGFYWYTYPNQNTPESEAESFITTVGGFKDGELCALDFEESFSEPVGWCLRFLQHFEALTGYKPLLYINLALVQAHDWTPVIQNNTGLWLAKWDFNPDGSIPLIPWPVCAMRQYTDKLSYNGQLVDGDVLYGDSTTFLNYGYKSTPSMTQDQQNILNFLASINANEGKVREAFGALQDAPAKDTQIVNLTAQVTDLTGKLTDSEKTVADQQTQLSTANSQINSETTQIASLTTDRDTYKAKYVQLLNNQPTWSDIITIILNKLSIKN